MIIISVDVRVIPVCVIEYNITRTISPSKIFFMFRYCSSCTIDTFITCIHVATRNPKMGLALYHYIFLYPSQKKPQCTCTSLLGPDFFGGPSTWKNEATCLK